MLFKHELSQIEWGNIVKPVQDGGRGEGAKRSPHQFFPCNFYKHRNETPKLCDF